MDGLCTEESFAIGIAKNFGYDDISETALTDTIARLSFACVQLIKENHVVPCIEHEGICYFPMLDAMNWISGFPFLDEAVEKIQSRMKES